MLFANFGRTSRRHISCLCVPASERLCSCALNPSSRTSGFKPVWLPVRCWRAEPAQGTVRLRREPARLSHSVNPFLDNSICQLILPGRCQGPRDQGYAFVVGQRSKGFTFGYFWETRCFILTSEDLGEKIPFFCLFVCSNLLLHSRHEMCSTP